MFIANTWRTLGRISEPQGCHYTVFLTSATFPSHPKTHDCSANKEHASSGDTEDRENPSPQSASEPLGSPGRHVELKSRCCSCAEEPDFGLNRLVGESLNKCKGLPALSIR